MFSKAWNNRFEGENTDKKADRETYIGDCEFLSIIDTRNGSFTLTDEVVVGDVVRK